MMDWISIQFYFLEKIQSYKVYNHFYFFESEVTLYKKYRLVIKDRIRIIVKGERSYISKKISVTILGIYIFNLIIFQKQKNKFLQIFSI